MDAICQLPNCRGHGTTDDLDFVYREAPLISAKSTLSENYENNYQITFATFLHLRDGPVTLSRYT